MNHAIAHALRRAAQALRLVADTLDPPLMTQKIHGASVTYYRS